MGLFHGWKIQASGREEKDDNDGKQRRDERDEREEGAVEVMKKSHMKVLKAPKIQQQSVSHLFDARSIMAFAREFATRSEMPLGRGALDFSRHIFLTGATMEEDCSSFESAKL